LKNKVKALEEELENSKTDFENLEMLYKNSSYKCEKIVNLLKRRFTTL